VGLAGSANIGEHCAMFEAIHGSAPRRAGQNLANPSGLLLGGVQMLVHVGQSDVAERVHNAWLKTIEDGIHTYDIFEEGVSKQKVGTQEFAEAVIARIGQRPTTLRPAEYAERPKMKLPTWKRTPGPKKETVGIDVFVDAPGIAADALAATVKKEAGSGLTLAMITNRGVKVWPGGLPETFCTDHWRCRFMAEQGKTLSHAAIAELLGRLAKAGVDFIKTEHLCTFNGEPGYSLGQGQ
jgi:isocitrate dehydrogenase